MKRGPLFQKLTRGSYFMRTPGAGIRAESNRTTSSATLVSLGGEKVTYRHGHFHASLPKQSIKAFYQLPAS